MFANIKTTVLAVGLIAPFISVSALSAPTCTTLCVVTPTGNNANAGDALNPLLTIQAAVNQVSANGVVQVNAGAYSELVVVAKDDISITGASAATVSLTAPVLNVGFGIHVSGNRTNVHISGITIQNFQVGIQFGTNPDNQTNVSARNLVASNNGSAGIAFQSGGTLQTATVSNVVANNNGGAGAAFLRRGVWVGYGTNLLVLIENSTFNNNFLVGIDVVSGVARGVTIQNNTVVGNADSGIALLAPIGPEASLIANNTVTNNGRFGIEIKNPGGNGAASGAGSVVVRGNVVSRTTAVTYTDGRDSAGIIAFKRLPTGLQPAQPSGVWIERNTVTGYKRASGAITAPPPVSGVGDGFGIVVEGTNHSVVFNLVSDNNVGIQLQSANPTSTSARADPQIPHFDRGDAASLSAVVNNNAMCFNTDFAIRKYEGAAGAGATVTNASNNWWRSISGFNPPGTGDSYSASGNALGAGNGSLTVAPFMVSSTDSFLTGNAICPVPVTPNPNQPPSANDDFVNMNPNAVGVFNVLANDSDPNGDALTVTAVSVPLHGTVLILPSGELQYTPVANYAGQDILTYTISDGKGGSATANIVIRITNRSPIALPDIATTFVNAPVIITVLANDTEPDSQPLTVVSATTPAHGTVLINVNGTIRYTPTSGYAGMDTFNYTINDGVGGVSTTTVTVTVVNRAPLAANDAATTFVNSAVTIPVVANDSDPDGSPLTVISTSVPAHGAVIINANGTVTYTPANGYVGADSFTYTISDGSGGTATATVNISVGNRNPVALNDTASTVLNTAVTIPVLTNDTDPDAQLISVSSVSTPTRGTAVVNANGTITYTPNNGYLGVDSFTYTISDGAGGTATATVNITVGNRNPVAVNDTASTVLNTAVTIPVLTNDTDPDAQLISVSSVSTPTRGTAVVNANGTITYTPNNGYLGVDSFTYTISDGAGGTATATVNVTITAPIATIVADTVGTTVNAPVTIAVLANDTLPVGAAATVVILVSPTRGTAMVNANGTITYTPNNNVVGADSFTYAVLIGGAQVGSASVTLTVTNRAPVARTASLMIAALNTRVPLLLGADDADVGGAIARYEIRSLPTCAQILLGDTVLGVGAIILPGQLPMLTVVATCAAETGFSFVAIDNLGLASAEARMSLSIQPAAVAAEPQQVPTLSSWALLCLIGLLALFGRKHIKRAMLRQQ